MLKDLVSITTRDLLLKDLIFASTIVPEYIRTKKHQETKHPFPSHKETEFRFQDTETILSKTPKLFVSKTPKLSVSKMPKLSVSETPKRNSVSTPLETEFCFHSTRNKIPLHLKRNSVSTPLEMEFCFLITLLYKPNNKDKDDGVALFQHYYVFNKLKTKILFLVFLHVFTIDSIIDLCLCFCYLFLSGIFCPQRVYSILFSVVCKHKITIFIFAGDSFSLHHNI